jgi:hypothetical protein
MAETLSELKAYKAAWLQLRNVVLNEKTSWGKELLKEKMDSTLIGSLTDAIMSKEEKEIFSSSLLKIGQALMNLRTKDSLERNVMLEEQILNNAKDLINYYN